MSRGEKRRHSLLGFWFVLGNSCFAICHQNKNPFLGLFQPAIAIIKYPLSSLAMLEMKAIAEEIISMLVGRMSEEDSALPHNLINIQSLLHSTDFLGITS